MSAKTKKWINRGGLVAIIIGVISYVASGGDTATAGEMVTVASGLTATALVLIREILG